MMVLFETIFLHLGVTKLKAEVCQNLPPCSVYSIHTDLLYHEVVQDMFVCCMLLLANDLFLVPTISEFVTENQLLKLWI